MKKKGFETDFVTQVTTNGYVLHAFSFRQEDPENVNTARVEAIYSLAAIGADGKATISGIPGQHHLPVVIFNVGDGRELEKWLEGNGTPADPLRFDYRDVERLIEGDIQARFGITFRGKK